MKFLGCFLISVGFLTSVFANESEPTNSLTDWQHNFDAKQREASVGSAVYFSPFIATKGRPVVNYAGASAQLGYMVNDLDEFAEWRGNYEVLAEAFGSGIFHGTGNYLAGTTFWLRYNLVPPQWKLVPYFQIGAGVTFTDADQRVFGQVFNFNLNVGSGVRYFIMPRCSLNGEYRFQHVSNANLANRNLGINAQGAMLSVSWYF
jgi:lipid A 3-O-deacylase